MPKRSLDIPDMAPGERVPPVKAQKTERSHEENQERAYIAASRRADRSLEARVQSARMASEIHRRRTGRGLKVTEEIVLKEEMYEEEEDDLPRQYRYLAAHLRTNSSDMNSRVSAYITTQAAMATMARYNEVNRLFSESFPSASTYQQQLNNSMYMAPLVNNNTANGAQPYSPSSPSPVSTPQSRSQSISGPPPFNSANNNGSGGMPQRPMSSKSTPSSTPNMTSISSPPPLSPGSASHTTDSRSTPCQTPIQAFPALDPQLHAHHQQPSSFTSELPNEIKMMANVDMSDPMAPYFFGGDMSGLPMFGPPVGGGDGHGEAFKIPTGEDQAEPVGAHKMESLQQKSEAYSSAADDALLDESAFCCPMDGGDAQLDYSQLDMSGAGMNEGAWESFVDFGSEQ